MPGTTAYPAALDTFPAIDANTSEAAPGVEHDVVHENVHAAVLALQEKVGVDSSADPDSVDARLAAVESDKVDAAQIGVAGGVAPLDGSGQVPAANLPSYVDDVLEFANLAAFPGSGETGKIYIAIDTGKQYRWSGSAYAELVASPGTTDALVEGSTNLYHTTERAQDAVATAFAAGTHSGMTVDYDDAGNRFNLTVTGGGGSADVRDFWLMG